MRSEKSHNSLVKKKLTLSFSKSSSNLKHI
jgi:hypothetical protein